MHLNFCQEMSFTHASTDLNFNFAAVNQVSGPLGKQKFTSTGSKGQVKRSRLSVVIGRFRSISFVFVSAGILIPRYLCGKTLPHVFSSKNLFEFGKLKKYHKKCDLDG